MNWLHYEVKRSNFKVMMRPDMVRKSSLGILKNTRSNVKVTFPSKVFWSTVAIEDRLVSALSSRCSQTRATVTSCEARRPTLLTELYRCCRWNSIRRGIWHLELISNVFKWYMTSRGFSAIDALLSYRIAFWRCCLLCGPRKTSLKWTFWLEGDRSRASDFAHSDCQMSAQLINCMHMKFQAIIVVVYYYKR